MTNYLLLRDNKQSGPYTFDQLKAKGLKAYDLVWVEGKSAAWRYPCEIAELSSLAPPVEEQPFDRFYKKPSEKSKAYAADNVSSVRSGNSTVTQIPGRTSANPPVAATILTGDTNSPVPGKRIIHVTLPAGKAAQPARPVREELPPVALETASTLHERYLPEYSLPAAASSQPKVFEDIPAQSNGHWRSSVENTPRGHRSNRSSRVSQTLLVGLTVMALLAAGIFIGLSLNKDSLGFVKRLSLNTSKELPPAKVPPAEHVSQPLAANNIPPLSPTQDTATRKDNIRSISPARPQITTAPVSKTGIASKEKAATTAQKPAVTTAVSKDSSLLAVSAVHREASHRSDMTTEKADKDLIRGNLSNLVSIGASGYTVGTFGGISNLQLTVSNHSIYSLDLVVVEVQYIQSNKKVFKTENLYFRGVAPGAALMQEAPKSSRGIKVQYKITLVNSKELGLSYSAIRPVPIRLDNYELTLTSSHLA